MKSNWELYVCAMGRYTTHVGRCKTLTSFSAVSHIQFLCFCTLEVGKTWHQGYYRIWFWEPCALRNDILFKCIFVLTDAVAFHSAHFGAGIGPIHLDDVGCTGSENHLIDCSRSSSVRCYYGHSEDAGVRCQGGNYCQCLLSELW